VEKSKSKLFLIITILSLIILLSTYFIFLNISQKEKIFETISSELNILNWEDYTGTPELIEKFENLYNIKINIETYNYDTEIYEKNISSFDLILVSQDQITELNNLDLITSLNFKYLDNMNFISPECVLSKPSLDFLIPYLWGTNGVIVNEKYIPDHKNSWDILWDKKYSGKTMMINSVEEVIIANSMNIHSTVYPSNLVELENEINFIKFQYDNLYGYYNDLDILSELFESGEIWAVQAYSGDLGIIETDEPLKYFIPVEGTIKWIDGFVIPKTSKNKYTAYLFANFLLEENNNAELAEHYKTPVCNENAKKYLPSNFLNDDSIYPNKFVKDKLKFTNDFKSNSELNDLKQDISNLLKSKSK
jgi:spermidine/putrescine transport system substrate-binding protein